MKRPRSVNIISLFYWLNALVLGAIGCIAIFSLAAPYLGDNQVSEEVPGILLWGSLFVGIIALAIFSAVVGSGLWQLKAWARRAAIVVSSLVIVVNLIVFVIGFMSGQFSIPYGIVLHGLVLWVLNSMSVKAVFEPITIEPSTDIPIANKEKRLETEQGANLESRIICPDCGNAGLSKDRFCRKCGNPLK